MSLPCAHSSGGGTGIGTAVLLANWTCTFQADTRYSTAAAQQLDYLLNVAPRSDTGAISQRVDQVQLWYVKAAKL